MELGTFKNIGQGRDTVQCLWTHTGGDYVLRSWNPGSEDIESGASSLVICGLLKYQISLGLKNEIILTDARRPI